MAPASPTQARARALAARLGKAKRTKQPAPKPPSHGLALGSAVALLAAVGAVLFALPQGLRLGGQPLDTAQQAALLLGAVAAGLWGAFSARDGRVFAGFLLAAALLAPSYDPRGPMERLPFALLGAVLFLLAVEFALLHAKVARLAAMPRAHVVQVGKPREVELSATAGRIAGSWPGPLLVALGIVVVMVGLAFALRALAPPALGESVEMRGPFGLAMAGVAVLGVLGVVAARRGRGFARAEQAQGSLGASPPAPSPGAPASPSAPPASAPASGPGAGR